MLDEPTSALDPAAAEDVLAALTRLVHDLGVTVVLAEHRLERVIEYADMVVVVDAFGNATSGSPAEMMRVSEVAPPVVRLGQAVGWDPLPLSVRDARRRSGDLRTRLDGRSVMPVPADRLRRSRCGRRRVVVRYGDVVAVAGVDLDLHAGQVLAVMGRNGSGKSSLLWALQGSGPRHRRHGRTRRRRRRPGDDCPRAKRRHASVSCRSRPAICCTCRRSPQSARSPTARADSRPAHAVRCSTGSCRASPTTPIHATCPRGSDWRWRWRCSCARVRLS